MSTGCPWTSYRQDVHRMSTESMTGMDMMMMMMVFSFFNVHNNDDDDDDYVGNIPYS
jgi:hypothetical protein